MYVARKAHLLEVGLGKSHSHSPSARAGGLPMLLAVSPDHSSRPGAVCMKGFAALTFWHSQNDLMRQLRCCTRAKKCLHSAQENKDVMMQQLLRPVKDFDRQAWQGVACHPIFAVASCNHCERSRQKQDIAPLPKPTCIFKDSCSSACQTAGFCIVLQQPGHEF